MAAQQLVGLYVTCLVDLWRPSVALATLRLLEENGCRVEVPAGQTCCGQPALNGGDRDTAAALARKTIAELEPYDQVVVPSGSCAAVIKLHYPRLLAEDPVWSARAERLAARTHEALSFLHEVLDARLPGRRWAGTATYHDGCSGLRELGVRAQPRALLGRVSGLELREMDGAEVCCGFGGTFCVKYPELSARLVGDKLRAAQATGAGTLLGGDLGCLLNIAGRASREGVPLRCFHAVEALAGGLDGPAIGERAAPGS